MKRLMTLLLLVVSAVSAFAGDGRIHRAGKPVPNQYIAVFNDDAPGRSEIAADFVKRFDVTTQIVFGNLHGFAFEGTEQAAQAIARDPRVAWVEENAYAEPTQLANTTTRPFPPGWALDRTNQELPPLDNSGGPGCSTAVGGRIYIVDSGINDVSGTEFGSRLRHLYKPHYSSNYPYTDRDPYGHGTSVAGMAGGSRTGLARGAEIVNVKIIDTGGNPSTAVIIDAIGQIDVDHYKINQAAATKRAAVVNISYYIHVITPTQTAGDLSALATAVQSSVKGCNATAIQPHLTFDGFNIQREQCTSYNTIPTSYGLTYVVGAGNNNSGSITGVPARLGDDAIGTITVGATMMRDEWTTDWRGIWPNGFGSNYGPEVDIWAPGTQVDVLCHLAGCANGIKKVDGTSLASPLVAGQVARLQGTYSAYTAQQIETQLKSWGRAVISDVPGGLLMQYAAGKCRSVGF